MFVIQLKNKGDEILAIKYNDDTKKLATEQNKLKKLWQLKYQNKDSHNSEAAKEKTRQKPAEQTFSSNKHWPKDEKPKTAHNEECLSFTEWVA